MNRARAHHRPTRRKGITTNLQHSQSVLPFSLNIPTNTPLTSPKWHVGLVSWDLRFSGLEQVSHKPCNYSFRGNAMRTSYMRNRNSFPIGNRGFLNGQCYQFEQFGTCPVLRACSNTPVPSVPVSTPPIAAPCALSVLTQSDKLLQSALQTPIDSKVCHNISQHMTQLRMQFYLRGLPQVPRFTTMVPMACVFRVTTNQHCRQQQ